MKIILRIATFVLLGSCAQQTIDAEETHMVTIHRTDGTVYSEVSYKGEKPHGPSRIFHPNGKLYLEIMYRDGIKHGLSRQYYKSGVLYLEAIYVDGVIEGVTKKYHKDGKLKAELQFREDFPCAGLKEYILDGSPRPHYPEIIITPESKLLTDNEYLLHVSLSERVQSATYFIGTLNGDCLHDALQDVPAEGKDKGMITIHVVPGESVKGIVNVIARIETIAGNTLVTQQTHQLEIDFAY